MSYRVITSTKEDVVNAIIKIGAKKGSNRVTMRDLAKECNVSTFKIIDFFSTKKAYLDYAAQSIDIPYIEKAFKLVDSGLTNIEIFNIFLDDFLLEPDKALFYLSYTNDFGFDPTTNNVRQETFLKIAKAFFKDSNCIDDDHILLCWDYITSMLFYYAEKIIHGYIENNEKNRNWINNLIFNGI